MILIEAREWIYVIHNRNYCTDEIPHARSSTAIRYKRKFSIERILLIIRIFV